MAELLTKNQTFASPSSALAHHGVKGMKWGVRKDDKPKGSSGKAAEEPKKINVKKAERHERNAALAQKQIDAIDSAPASKWKYIQNQRATERQQWVQYRDKNIKDAKDVREGRMTDGQRKALIGVAAVGGVLAAYGAYKFVDSGQYTQSKANLQERLSGEKFAWKKNDKLRKASDEDSIFNSVVKPINEGYGAIGTKMNCRRCTFAYEMRRRGYDVKATKSSSGTGQTTPGLLNAIDPNSKLKTGRYGIMIQAIRESGQDGGGPLAQALSKTTTWGQNSIFSSGGIRGNSQPDKSRSIFDALSKQPNGARGELGMGWVMGGGHSMAWEVVRGKPVIFDTQSGKRWNNPEAFKSVADTMGDAGFTRLDNLTLNDEFLKRWVQNAD